MVGRRAPGQGRGGQTAVEVLALVPVLVLLVLAGWQAVAWVAAWHLAGQAAGAGARAAEVGAPAERAARALLPPGWASHAAVTQRAARGGAAEVRVVVTVPAVLPWAGAWATVTGGARVRP